MLNFINKRTDSQPLNLPNAGSIFKRDNDIIPALLIDKAGLKGTRINDAEISTKHAGFIVNNGNAKCKDVIMLMDLVKSEIYNKYNACLTPEIEYLPY